MKCAEFIGTLFLARDVAHSTHLSTRSFAKHSALGDFYVGIIELADKFAEAYQGKYGLIGAIPLQSAKRQTNVVEFLENQLEEIEKGRDKLFENNDSALQNIVDEIVGLYLTTLYKLKFLS